MRKTTKSPLAMALMAGLGLVAVGCDAGSTEPNAPEVATVSNTLSDMLATVSACAAEKAACQDDADAGFDETYADMDAMHDEDSDAGYDESDGPGACQLDFKACRDAADEGAKPDVDHGVSACVAKKKACEAAADPSVDCDAALSACLGSDVEPPDMDASMSPVRECIDALHSCIKSDAAAGDCGQQVRDCVLEMAPGQVGKPAPMDEDGGMDMDDTMDEEPTDMDDTMDEPSVGMPSAQDCQTEFAACLESGAARAECQMARTTCLEALPDEKM